LKTREKETGKEGIEIVVVHTPEMATTLAVFLRKAQSGRSLFVGENDYVG